MTRAGAVCGLASKLMAPAMTAAPAPDGTGASFNDVPALMRSSRHRSDGLPQRTMVKLVTLQKGLASRTVGRL